MECQPIPGVLAGAARRPPAAVAGPDSQEPLAPTATIYYDCGYIPKCRGALKDFRDGAEAGSTVYNWRKIAGIAAVVVLIGHTELLAWGPATHVKLASDLLAQTALLPAAVAMLLRRHARDYLFGNIAADVVIAKRLSRIRQFCHHWKTGLAILDDARTDRSRAFALGYLSHLAADTVAHNKFVPRQITLTRTTISFGHLYWELRADSTIGPHYWQALRGVLTRPFGEHEASLSLRLTDTFLPFSVNWRLFFRLNHFVSRRFCIRAMDRWNGVSRWPLSDQLMREYRAECLDRMIDVVTRQHGSAVLHEDPNGNAALACTKVHRRQIRQMARAGLIAPHIYTEAAAGHAPATRVPVPRRTALAAVSVT